MVMTILSELQDQEVGDGTTSVVILAAQLLKAGNELVKNKVHPTSVIQGFRLAMRQACKYVSEEMAINPPLVTDQVSGSLFPVPQPGAPCSCAVIAATPDGQNYPSAAP